MVSAVEHAPILEGLAERVRPTHLAQDRTLVVREPLRGLLPEGLRRGTVVSVGAATGVAGATTLALALAAGPSQAGAWVAVVGAPTLGLVAAADLGVAFERLVVVRAPARDVSTAAVVAALVDGFDVVLVGSEARARLQRRDTRRLLARVRERGAVVLGVGDDLPGGGAAVRLQVTASAWEGVDEGAGHLRSRRATVEAVGRGAASRPRRAELLLPGPDGGVAAAVEAVDAAEPLGA